MGITMEIYLADQETFVSLQRLLASESLSEEEAQPLFDQLEAYPHADFSLHLHWPEDINALCHALIAEGFSVPSCTTPLLVEEVWSDGVSACVYRMSQDFPLALAAPATENAIETIAKRWVTSFLLDPDTASYTTAYDAAVKALSALCHISHDALAHNTPLFFFLQW